MWQELRSTGRLLRMSYCHNFNIIFVSRSCSLLHAWYLASTPCRYKFEMWNWSSNFSACSDFYLQLNVTSNLPLPPLPSASPAPPSAEHVINSESWTLKIINSNSQIKNKLRKLQKQQNLAHWNHKLRENHQGSWEHIDNAEDWRRFIGVGHGH